jgi:hypothetical protein
MTVMDPQTGHYVAGLPVDPALMSKPAIYKGIDGAIEGFNSAVATVAYGIGLVQQGGSLNVGFGSDSLNYQSLRVGHVSKDGIGVAVSAARSEGDGSLPFGDHEFSRLNVHLQAMSNEVQSDVIVSYQDKFGLNTVVSIGTWSMTTISIAGQQNPARRARSSMKPRSWRSVFRDLSGCEGSTGATVGRLPRTNSFVRQI